MSGLADGRRRRELSETRDHDVTLLFDGALFLAFTWVPR